MSQQDARQAGSYSRLSPYTLDGTRPFSGLIGDPPVLKAPRTASSRSRYLDHRDGTVSLPAISRAPRTPHMTGGLPRQGMMKQQVSIPGYGGHVAGKVAENVHGMTFGEENERATGGLSARETLYQSLSSPDLHRRTLSRSFSSSSDGGSPKQGLNVAPHVPGYRGHVPGKDSENVHAGRFAEANATANSLRRYNPHANSECWLRRGEWPADRMATYKFIKGRVATLGFQGHFTNEEEAAANESNRRLGHTFGMKPPAINYHRPGDRFLHDTQFKKPARLNPADAPVAGQSSYAIEADGPRWKAHYMLVMNRGNQRPC